MVGIRFGESWQFSLSLSLPPSRTDGPVSRCLPVGVRQSVCTCAFACRGLPPALVDVSLGRDDGRGDVRVAVLVCNAPVDFHSIHVSIEHLDVPDPLLARIPRARASLATSASTHAGGRPDGDGTGAWLGF